MSILRRIRNAWLALTRRKNVVITFSCSHLSMRDSEGGLYVSAVLLYALAEHLRATAEALPESAQPLMAMRGLIIDLVDKCDVNTPREPK